MKRLSKQMETHLVWCANLEGAVKILPPTHHANQVTHDALVRRGLLVDTDGETKLTDAGRNKAREIRSR